MKLEPICSIEVDFGKPLALSAPSVPDFLNSLKEEANLVENDDERFEVQLFGHELWENSLTSEEKKEYARISSETETALGNYNPREDPPESEPAKAYSAAAEKMSRWEDSHGQHICYDCSYYTIPEDRSQTAICFKLKKTIRPTCLACRRFTTDSMTAEFMQIQREFADRCARDPNYAAKVRKAEELDRARHIARRLSDNSPVGDFPTYERFSKDYETAYRKFPEVFASTPYPTFESFKSAAESFMEKRQKKPTLKEVQDLLPPTTPSAQR